MRLFLELVDSAAVGAFLDKHRDFDRYYVAGAYIYFQRAELHDREYTPRNFAIAMHIMNAIKASRPEPSVRVVIFFQEDDCDSNDHMLDKIREFARAVGFPTSAAFMV